LIEKQTFPNNQIGDPVADLRILDMGVLPDLSSNGGSKLRDSDDIVEIVDFHDRRKRSTS